MSENNQVAVAVPKPKAAALAIPAEWGVGNSQSGYLTSIDDSKPDGKMLVFRLLTEKGRDIRDVVNQEIELVDYLLTPATFNDEKTGEEVSTIVTRLILSDGTWIETHSFGVVKTLGFVCQFFGQPPWKSPVRVTPIQQQLKNNKSWFILKLTGTPKLPGTRERKPQ